LFKRVEHYRKRKGYFVGLYFYIGWYKMIIDIYLKRLDIFNLIYI
jgi:hypothetical protein